MSTLIIEKYVDGICVEKLQLPVTPLQLLAKLLPSKARRDMLRHGLDIDALLNDPPTTFTEQWLEVEEKKVAKRIRISRQ